MMTALMLGIFSSAGVYVSRSAGDLWAGYPGTQSVELGRPIPRDTEMWLRMDPAVAQVEPFQWIDGDWRGTGRARRRVGVRLRHRSACRRPDVRATCSTRAIARRWSSPAA